jgi:Flp pilus assembly protein TadD
MNWRQGLLIGLAGVSALVASGVVYISQRVDAYIVEQGASGAYLAARQATLSKDSEAAGDYWSIALLARPKDQNLLSAALQAQILAGQAEAGVTSAQRIIADKQDHRQARLLLAIDAFKQKNYAAAQSHLSAMEKGPFAEMLNPNIRLWISVAQKDLAARDRAIQQLGRGSVFASVPLSHSARVLELAGEPDKAERYYQDGVRAGGARYLFFTLSYGEFLHRRGELRRARKLYAFYASQNLDNAYLKAAQARLDVDQPAPLEASPQAGLASAFGAIAEAMATEQRMELALGFYRMAQHLEPENDRISFAIASLMGQRERFVRAAEEFAAIAADAPSYADAQIQRAQMLFQAGASEAAIAVLSAQARAMPDNRDILISLGDLYRSEQRFAEAETAYDKAIEMGTEIAQGPNPRDWFLYFARGMMRERLGSWDMAELDLQTARKLSGDEPNVLNYLGYSWINQGIYLDEGLKIIREAVKKEPKNGAFVDSLGWAHYRLGNYKQALILLERASKIESGDPVVTDHLGDALWRVGRQVEARYQWRKALAFEPTLEDRAKIEDKLLTGLGPAEKKKPKAHMPRGGTAI